MPIGPGVYLYVNNKFELFTMYKVSRYTTNNPLTYLYIHKQITLVQSLITIRKLHYCLHILYICFNAIAGIARAALLLNIDQTDKGLDTCMKRLDKQIARPFSNKHGGIGKDS